MHKLHLHIADHSDMCDINESVKEIIRQCESCQRTKEVVKLTANEPLEKVYIDRYGLLQETFGKKR